MNRRWSTQVDFQWQRAACLLDLLDVSDGAAEAALLQATLWQIEYAAICYATECSPDSAGAALSPERLADTQGRRWHEFASVVAPLLRACAALRSAERPQQAGGALKNPLFATEEQASSLIAREVPSVEGLTAEQLRALMASARDIIARQRVEAEEF